MGGGCLPCGGPVHGDLTMLKKWLIWGAIVTAIFVVLMLAILSVSGYSVNYL